MKLDADSNPYFEAMNLFTSRVILFNTRSVLNDKNTIRICFLVGIN